jgi:hypothetical protein
MNTDLANIRIYIGACQISDADVPATVELLTRRFRSRPRKLWDVFATLSRRSIPGGFPRYRYVIESNHKLVGI